MIELQDLNIEKYLKLLDTLKEHKFSRHVRTARETILAHLKSTEFSPLVHGYLASMHAEGEPFTNFEHDPKQISQIKKIINALYHTEIVLLDAESFDFRNGERKLKDLVVLYNHTFHHIYKAGYLATHFDIDLGEIFSRELAAITPLFNLLKDVAEPYGEEAKGFFANMDRLTIPHTAGLVSGVVIDQLDPSGGEADYAFLTQFSAIVPEYLDKLSGYIEQLSSTVSQHEPNIDKRKLDELQGNALQLLSALERVRGNSAFMPLRILHYIYIIRNTITLTKSIFEQAGHLKDSTQDTARAKLAELKYKLLPELFGFTDKIEEQAMLTPGMLTNPLMTQVSRFYEVLIRYTKKFVDFSVKGRGLVTVEDSRFVDERLELTYQRSVEDQIALLEIEEAQIAANKFFEILHQPENSNQRMVDLPEATKQLLATYYKQIQSYVISLNAPLHNAIIAGLAEKKGYFDFLQAPLRWFSHNTDSWNDILLMQPLLETKLVKMRNSHQLHLKLNSDIIVSIAERIEHLKLFPFRSDRSPFVINEAEVLIADLVAANNKMNNKPRPHTLAQATTIAQHETAIAGLKAVASTPRLTNLAHLTLAQALSLYQVYLLKCAKLERAQIAYDEFHQLIRSKSSTPQLNHFDDETKKKLRNLYSVFQPYLVSGLSPVAKVRKFDRELVEVLNEPTDKPAVAVETSSILAVDTRIRACFTSAQGLLDERCRVFANLVKTLKKVELTDKPLVKAADEQARAHYVLKHDIYSKALGEFKENLFKLTSYFNGSVRAQLQRAKSGLPFPEIKDSQKALAQSTQVVGLKRLFNCLYHLEKIGKLLESLKDNSYETTYAIQILRISSNVHDAIDLMLDVAATPYFSVLVNELRCKWQKVYGALIDVRKHYIPEAAPGESTDFATGHHPALYYSLSVLTILPEHITALRGDTDLTSEEIQTLLKHAADVSTDIERILKNSNSYVKLFLEIPTMYKLFHELKGKLIDLATVSHGAAMDHLADMNNVIFAKMFLEADKWEDGIGLIPGTLTGPLKEMLDAFYQGFLEPHGLNSQRHIALVANISPIEQRIEAAQKRAEQSAQEQQVLAKQRELIQQLLVRLKDYRAHRGGNPEQTAVLKRLLITDFQNAAQILKEVVPNLGKKFKVGSVASQEIDKLLNGCGLEKTQYVNIEEIAEAMVIYFQGQHASYQLIIDSAQAKKTYLDTLKHSQLDLVAKFTEKYTKASFTEQVKRLSTKQVGLIYCSNEYGQKLAEWLNMAEPEIVRTAKDAEDINKKTEELLLARVKQFEQDQYRDYFHLETMIAAIDKLRRYNYYSNIAIQKNQSVFENDKTLAKKVALVKKLQSIVDDKNIPIQARLSSLKAVITKPSFKIEMYDHAQFDRLTFAWLKQCILDFLELIRLYTPEYKKCYTQLVNSTVRPAANIASLSARYGLFADNTPGRAYDLPLLTANAQQPVVPALA